MQSAENNNAYDAPEQLWHYCNSSRVFYATPPPPLAIPNSLNQPEYLAYPERQRTGYVGLLLAR